MTFIKAWRTRRVVPLLLSLCVAVACARDDVRGSAGTTTGAESQLPATTLDATGPIDTVRAPAGTWSLGLAENKLRNAQMSPVRQGTDVRRTGFAVPATRYALGPAQLEIFLYADAVARGRDTDILDLRRLEQGQRAPVLIADGNLAALLFTADAALASRVRAALRTDVDDGPLEPAGVVPPRSAPESSP